VIQNIITLYYQYTYFPRLSSDYGLSGVYLHAVLLSIYDFRENRRRLDRTYSMVINEITFMLMHENLGQSERKTMLRNGMHHL
jgi:hypothetical protein